MYKIKNSKNVTLAICATLCEAIAKQTMLEKDTDDTITIQ